MNKLIKIKYLSDVTKINKITKGDWIDLYTAKEIKLKKGEFTTIPLGVAIQLPVGYEGILAQRSSTFKNYGVIQTNSIGIIDESYCGDNDEWVVQVYATRDCLIPKNARICQFRILAHQPEIEIEEVTKLGNKDRGGIGSTGK